MGGFIRPLVFVCAFLSAAKIATFSHSTVHPVGLTISKPGVQPGYIIFGAPDGHAYAIDVKGNVAKKWSSPEPNKELEYARPVTSWPKCGSRTLHREQPVQTASSRSRRTAALFGNIAIARAF